MDASTTAADNDAGLALAGLEVAARAATDAAVAAGFLVTTASAATVVGTASFVGSGGGATVAAADSAVAVPAPAPAPEAVAVAVAVAVAASCCRALRARRRLAAEEVASVVVVAVADAGTFTTTLALPTTPSGRFASANSCSDTVLKASEDNDDGPSVSTMASTMEARSGTVSTATVSRSASVICRYVATDSVSARVGMCSSSTEMISATSTGMVNGV